MTDPHIEYLDIENFKCFQKLEMKNIQRVNLIGGKNNVGKTALLEAVELLMSQSISRSIFAATFLLKKRQSAGEKYLELDFFYNSTEGFEIRSNHQNYEIYLSADPESVLSGKDTRVIDYPPEMLSFTLGFEKESVELEGFLRKELLFSSRNKDLQSLHTFVRTCPASEDRLAILFGALIDLDREEFLNKSLSLFDDNISSFKQIVTPNGVVLKLKLKDHDKLVLLSSMGEGVSRYIAILCAIWASKDGVLLIDEIENGIHYSNYPKLWKIIFQASKDANCQVFATSHSKECIEAFNEAQRDYGDGMYFELYKNLKTGMIDISGRETEQLEYALTHGGKVRGE